DQGYLDEFPKRFGGVRVLDHTGINAAPWNIDGAAIEEGEGAPRIHGQPLLFYHFQGLRELLRGWFDPGLLFYSAEMTDELHDLVYVPYLQNLAGVMERRERAQGIVPRRGYHRLTAETSWRARWDRTAARWLLPIYRLARGQLIHVKREGGR